MTEDIITALSSAQSLFVIARNSSFTFKGQAVDVKDVGRDLGVRYVVEGSVRRAGNRIRITAQLLDATTGKHVWADRFDRALEDIFDLQDEVTESVVCASWCYRRHVQIRGMTLSEEDRAESIRLAELALKLDGTDPYVLWQSGISMWVPYGILANAHMQLQQHEEAASWARKSLAQHKFNLPAYHVLAASCIHLDRQTEAEKAVHQLRELDPELTVSRLQHIYPVARYRNLDLLLQGLRQAGLPE